MEIFSNVDALKKVDKKMKVESGGFQLLRHFQLVMLMFSPTTLVITMTTASKHGAKPGGFEKLSESVVRKLEGKNSLPFDFLATCDWCHHYHFGICGTAMYF